MSYKNQTYYIGSSDIASLTLRFPTKVATLDFGMDGDYYAHFITDDVEIPSHYEKEVSGKHWCKIYDDYGLVAIIDAKTIDFYRAGDMGVLIVVGDKSPTLKLYGNGIKIIKLEKENE